MSQTVLVICIYFFTRLQSATDIDATCSLPPDPVDCRGVYHKTQDEYLDS